MSVFDIENVEWPQEGFAHPAYARKMPPGPDHPGNVNLYYADAPEVVPADAYRKAVEELERRYAEMEEANKTFAIQWAKDNARIKELERGEAAPTALGVPDGDLEAQSLEAVANAIHGHACGCSKAWPTNANYPGMARAVIEALGDLARANGVDPTGTAARGEAPHKQSEPCPDQGGTDVCDDCPPDCPCYEEGK